MKTEHTPGPWELDFASDLSDAVVYKLEGGRLAMSGFYILLRAHDHVWEDKTWSLAERETACKVLWDLALKLALYPVPENVLGRMGI